MSLYAISQYHKEVEKIIHYGGTKKETAICNAFYNLLNQYAGSKDLMLITEISLKTKAGKTVTPDGTLKDVLRLDHGYWESKDESDDIDEEIGKKFGKGYPNDNILFEDSQTAVLIQHGNEVLRVPMEDGEELDKLLNRFVQFERQDVKDFRAAIEHFKQDIPMVTEAIRDIIERQFGDVIASPPRAKQTPEPQATSGSLLRSARNDGNPEFLKALTDYLALCKASINPDITVADVKEMMIQHILSADIFNTIFDEPHFHQENNIARELNRVVETFFTGAVRRETLGRIKHYYDTINAAAAGIADHHEKQKFLKVVYENFYKAYNPKAADRLGIVYTPTEIVQFMIRSTDYLLHKHFGKTLDSKNVEILDPATGTGTFICDIIDYLPAKSLEYKYKNELHANEVAILPYYIANLNIEYVYKQRTGKYAEFENLCFVDTLDNTGFHWVGKQGDLFGVSAENAARIRKQNERKISVVIGNPPYNANQANENDNNKNREYREIDKRIKETYIKNSTAQKTKLYDMYSRFYRWAMDRLTDNGIIAFITNRSFIDSRTFDGFRKVVAQDFDHAYIIDTKSDVRANPKIAGTTHNVFGIQAGVAVLFLVKTSAGKIKPNPCRIEYIALEDDWRKEVKLQWFVENPMQKIAFDVINPDKNGNWINLAENNWEELVPVVSKEAGAIFSFNTNGVSTQRDEWVFDLEKDSLLDKITFLKDHFNKQIFSETSSLDNTIKWSDALISHLKKGTKVTIDLSKLIVFNYRPFFKQFYYSEKILSDRLTANHYSLFGNNLSAANRLIAFSGTSSSKQFQALSINQLFGYDYLEKTNCLPLYRYTATGERIDNITDWSLELFKNHYQSEIANRQSPLTKEDIFHYVYAVLHHPAYRRKYELNLKREFPRIPLYDGFPQWVQWGKQLMELHIGYEQATPYPLEIILTNPVVESEAALAAFLKPKLKADKAAGTIVLDGSTTLAGIPPEAWDYKLGNRSALEWVLDQYKEKAPGDPTIAARFNTYRFADYKDRVTDLLLRVCTVSVETMRVVGEMPG